MQWVAQHKAVVAIHRNNKKQQQQQQQQFAGVEQMISNRK